MTYAFSLGRDGNSHAKLPILIPLQLPQLTLQEGVVQCVMRDKGRLAPQHPSVEVCVEGGDRPRGRCCSLPSLPGEGDP